MKTLRESFSSDSEALADKIVSFMFLGKNVNLTKQEYVNEIKI